MAFQIQIAGAEDLSRQQFVTEVVVQRSLYEHTRAQVTLRWHEHTRYDQRQTAHLGAQVLNCPIDITWKDNDLVEHLPCFHGYVENTSARRDATSSHLVLSCVAFSKRTDLIPRHRAFQATTLLDIAQQIAKSEPLIKIVNAGDLSKVPIVLSLQYAETDFVYLSRMLHAWGVPMAVKDLTGEVLLGARGTEAEEPFPDVGYGWTEVVFHGALQALPQMASGGAGLPAQVRGQVGQFLGQLSRLAGDYHATPEAPRIEQKVTEKASQTDTSGYHLILEGVVLPFQPGEVVLFEGQSHLIRQVTVVGHPEQTTATQEFTLQPLTLPLPPQRQSPRWPSRSVWGWVTANEHDPLQQGRIQVEFDWEEMDPQPSPDRAWLHTLTPYGGGSGDGKKSAAYSGFYSLPEVGERVLVEFVGDWDSEAVVIGVVRQSSQGTTFNPKHTKRWSTPSGNEIIMHTKDGLDVVQVKNQGRMVVESHVGKGYQSLTLNCGSTGSEPNMMHFQNNNGVCRLDIGANHILHIEGKNELHLKANSIFIDAASDLHLTGKTVDVKATDGSVKVDGAPNVEINTGPASTGASGSW